MYIFLHSLSRFFILISVRRKKKTIIPIRKYIFNNIIIRIITEWKEKKRRNIKNTLKVSSFYFLFLKTFESYLQQLLRYTVLSSSSSFSIVLVRFFRVIFAQAIVNFEINHNFNKLIKIRRARTE